MTEVAAALIFEGERFMICRRPAHKACGGLWEFVGGKAEAGETPAEALIRECREELDITVHPESVFANVTHVYPDITIHLTVFRAVIESGVPKKIEHSDIRFIYPSEIDNYDFCPADCDILEKIKRQARETTVQTVRERLFSMQDKVYRDFSAKLIPNLPKDAFIGVRVPLLRAYAKELRGSETAAEFLNILPHRYHEENCLHAFLIEGLGEFDRTLSAAERFFPYIDNWAVCDGLRPKCFGKHLPELLSKIKEWLNDPHPYTVRFGMEMLMDFYLDGAFDPAHLDLVASVRSEEYYVRMMAAWYFATALAKQYEAALSILENRVLDPFTHNKTIQKAVESYRISTEQKTYLRSLKIQEKQSR